MTHTPYHYTECGLDNVYLSNGFQFMETTRGKALSIHDVDGLHKAIGRFLATSKKNFSKKEIRFLREEMLLSQSALGRLLGISEQAVRRWEGGKSGIPKPSEFLLRLLYLEHANTQSDSVAGFIKEIISLEGEGHNKPLLFVETKQGWQAAA